MTKEQLLNIQLNERVSMNYLNNRLEVKTKLGYVVRVYRGNNQLKVWFDGEIEPRAVGYTQVNIV